MEASKSRFPLRFAVMSPTPSKSASIVVRRLRDAARFPVPARLAASPRVAAIEAVRLPDAAMVAARLEVIERAAETSPEPERLAVIDFPSENPPVSVPVPFNWVVEEIKAPFIPKRKE
jgi:hypothetical protein